MKKIIATLALVAVTASMFAQGNFIFSTTARYVWDDWSSVAIKPDGSNNVAFLFGSGTPLVDTATGVSGVATNTTSASWTTSQAWSSILSDPNFHLGTNNGSGLLAAAQTSNLGTISYLGGATFTVTGTAAAGGSTTVYVIGWNAAYADPFAAAAAGSAVGWSSPFTYSYAAGPVPGPAGTPGNFAAVLTPFGVFLPVAPVPEPGTMALAALGGASLLLFRRRK